MVADSGSCCNCNCTAPWRNRANMENLQQEIAYMGLGRLELIVFDVGIFLDTCESHSENICLVCLCFRQVLLFCTSLLIYSNKWGLASPSVPNPDEWGLPLCPISDRWMHGRAGGWMCRQADGQAAGWAGQRSSTLQNGRALHRGATEQCTAEQLNGHRFNHVTGSFTPLLW